MTEIKHSIELKKDIAYQHSKEGKHCIHLQKSKREF